MKQTMRLKLAPTPEQAQALLDTMHAFNEAANYVASVAFAEKTVNKFALQKLVYAAKKPEPLLLFSNGLLLLLVTIVPFPTALVGAYLTTFAASVACAIYAGFFVLVDSAYNLLWWAVSRQRPRDRLQGRRFSMSMLISLLGFPRYLIATAVAFWSPLLTLFICGALWIVWAITLPRPPTEQRNRL